MKETNNIVTLDNVNKLTEVHYTLNHSGKMEGMASLSTSCTCNKFCQQRSANQNLVCSHCYAQRQMKMYLNLEQCLIKNTEVLTSRILEDKEIPIINRMYFRFEAFGDLINVTQISNYFNICKKNKNVKFAIWTKNPWIIQEAINGALKKPSNLQIILSSPKINEVCDGSEYDFVDKVFTVFTKEYIEKKHIHINCGMKKCIVCRKCYKKSREKFINEKLK